MADILHELTIRTTPAKAFRAVTSADGLSHWWTKDSAAQPRVGSIAEFGFNKRAVVFRMQVVSLKRNREVRWRCLGGHPEWTGTRLVFSFTAVTGGTRVRFSHLGWKSNSGILAMCSFDWARYLMSLREYLESERGAPHGDSP